MQPPPKDWPRISSSLFYSDAKRAIGWLGEAFGFEPRIVVEADGHVQHSELTFGDGVVMVSEAGREDGASPAQLDGKRTQGLFVYVDDIEAHHARAVASGARIVRELAVSDYGEDYWVDRGYSCADLEGHVWYFAQRLRGKAA